jgi:hypothetical protein
MCARLQRSSRATSIAVAALLSAAAPRTIHAQDGGSDAPSTPAKEAAFTPTPTPAPPGPYTPPGYVPPAWVAPAAPPAPPMGSLAPAPAPRRAAGFDAERDPDPRVANAHADRVMILPTGYTHPAGTFYLSSYDIALLQIGYALSDDAQISLMGTPPIGDDAILPLDLSLKVVIHRERFVRVAGIGAVTGLIGLEEGNFLLGRVGAVTQLCFEEACESSVTMGATALLAGPATLTLAGVGLIWRVASWAALLLEVDTLIPLGSEAGEYNGIALLPALRLPYRTWSLDLGVVRALDTEEPPDPPLIPFIAFSYRFLP